MTLAGATVFGVLFGIMACGVVLAIGQLIAMLASRGDQ